MRADGSSDPLQFDTAENGGADAARLTTCARCSTPLGESYYMVNRFVLCPSCTAAVEKPSGTRAHRVSTALGLGTLAAIGGSLLYFAVAALTGREFGLVAIVVGFMVGKAVRRGSRGRGGWAYQALAVSLTYLAIVTTYVPLIAREFQHAPARNTRAGAAPPPIGDTLNVAPNYSGRTADSARRQPDSGFGVAQAGTPAPRQSTPIARHLGFETVVLGIGALLLLAAITPFAAGSSNLIGLLIIGIAVFEAWKLNRRVPVQISGPYRVAGGANAA